MAPAAPEVNEKGPGKCCDGVSPLLRVGGCLEVLAVNWSEFLGAICLVGQLSHPLPRLSSSPLSHPDIISDVPDKISSVTGLVPGGREDVVQGCLGDHPQSGSRLLQSSFPGGKGDGGGGSLSLSLSLSHLNEFVRQTPFKMETVASVLLSVREGDFLASINLKDVYFQIPVHQSSRKLLRILSEGAVYQFNALCFGLSTAPLVFTKVFVTVSAWAHSQGIRLLRYLDDWLVLASSEVEAKKEHPRSALGLSLPWGRDKRGEVRCNPLSDGKLPRYDHRYRGRQDFSVSCVSREISVGGGDVLYHDRSALAGGFESPGFAGEAGSSQSTSNELYIGI